VTPWKKPSAPWSASSACTKAIPFEIILQRPKDTAALLRRLSHAPANKIAAAKEGLTAAELLEFCPLETLSRQNHTAVVGESDSGKSLLTKYLIHSYFRDGHVRVYDSGAAPWEWGALDAAGRSGDYAAVAQDMAEDIAELRRRTALHGEGGWRRAHVSIGLLADDRHPLLPTPLVG
jgi:hypothetical protein